VAQTTIKIEGLESFRKMRRAILAEIINDGAKIIERHNKKIESLAKSKIHNVSGQTAKTIKSEIAHKSNTAVVSHIGTIRATKSEAIRATSLEYGHAKPGEAGGKKIPSTEKHSFIRPAIDEDKKPFSQDMKGAVNKVVKKYSAR
jgi:hypothetical protein